MRKLVTSSYLPALIAPCLHHLGDNHQQKCNKYIPDSSIITNKDNLIPSHAPSDNRKMDLSDFYIQDYEYNIKNGFNNDVQVIFHPKINLHNLFVLTFQYSVNGSENYYYQKQFQDYDSVPIHFNYDYVKANNNFLNFDFTLYLHVVWPDGTVLDWGSEEHHLKCLIDLSAMGAQVNLVSTPSTSPEHDIILDKKFDAITNNVINVESVKIIIRNKYSFNSEKFLLKNNDIFIELQDPQEIFNQKLKFSNNTFSTNNYFGYNFSKIDAEFNLNGTIYALNFKTNNYFDDIAEKIVIVTGDNCIGLFIPLFNVNFESNYYVDTFTIENFYGLNFKLNLFLYDTGSTFKNIFDFFTLNEK